VWTRNNNNKKKKKKKKKKKGDNKFGKGKKKTHNVSIYILKKLENVFQCNKHARKKVNAQ